MSFYIPQRNLFILGPSVYLPERVMTNQDVLDWMGVTARPSWIAHRTGVETRRWVREDQACSDIAAAAAQALFEEFRVDKGRISQLVLATVSGDYPTPPTSPLVLPLLGLKGVGVMDISAACTGFVTGLHVSAALSAATGKDHLLISADIRSKFLRKLDLATTALFGDGAASCLVTAEPRQASFRLIATELSGDGSLADTISIPAGGSRLPHSAGPDEEDRYLKMKNGATLFIRAAEMMADAAKSILIRLGLTLQDIDWVVPHQANLHLIRACADRLELPREKLVETVQFLGNTSGTTVGMALQHLRAKIGVRPGQKVLLVSAGAGGSSSCALLEAR